MRTSAKLAAIAFSAAFAIAAPLHAAAPEANSAVAATETGGSPAAKKAPGKNTRYCIKLEPTTGSRIGVTQCKTKAEWLEQGIDPTDVK